MKLLLDENISQRLVPQLQAAFPGSSHVIAEGLQRATDSEVWDHARDKDFVIATCDGDFEAMSVLLGAPPAVVWLRQAQVSSAEILSLLIENADFIGERIEGGAACVQIFTLAH